ncbi:MAG: WbqC family protein [Hyphomicrobiales bacterium]
MNTKQSLLFPSVFLPSVDYMAIALWSKSIVIDIHENYSKQTYRNRARILSPNGVLDLNIPVIKTKGNHTNMKDMGISFQEDWDIRVWKTIETSYSSSPYFLYYKDELKGVILNRKEELVDYNTELFKLVCELIDIDIKFSFSSSFIAYGEEVELRSVIHPKKTSPLTYFDEYYQVFSEKHGFKSNLSVLDLLMNKGPESYTYLMDTIERNNKELMKF